MHPTPLVTPFLLSASMSSFVLFVHSLLSVLYPAYECFFPSDFFPLACHPLDSSVLSHMAVFRLVLWLSSIPLYKCTTSSLSNHPIEVECHFLPVPSLYYRSTSPFTMFSAIPFPCQISLDSSFNTRLSHHFQDTFSNFING